MPSTLDEFVGLLAGLSRRIGDLALPPGFDPPGFRRRVLCETLAHLGRRLQEGPQAPLRIAIFGPTGVGKSKLFNSVAGSNLSPAGYRRPFTMRSVYLLHPSRQAMAERLLGEVRVCAGDPWRHVVLIDTPDFDSVETANQREAERVFREAEAFLFVTDVQKYADHSTWDYLERIFHEEKPVIVVLNKLPAGTSAAASDGPAGDFFARLDARFGAAARELERVVIDEYPLDDAAPIPPDDPHLARVRTGISRLAGSDLDRRLRLTGAFRADLKRFFAAWDAAAPALSAYLAGNDRLGERLAARFREGVESLRVELKAGIDPALRAEVYSRVLERLQRLDFLRYPRRILALPLEGLKSLARTWRPAKRGAGPEGPGEVPRSESFQLLESRLLGLAEAIRSDFQSERAAPALLDPQSFGALRLPHAEILEMYRQRQAAFAVWLKRQAEETASTLTGENKLKFILSQVIYNAVVVGVQVHTAGGFTLVELLTDSVLSPLVAKAVGIAVSSERVAGFERQAQAEHHRLLAEIVEAERARFAGYLESRGAWRGEFEAAAADVKRLRQAQSALVQAFEEGGRDAAAR